MKGWILFLSRNTVCLIVLFSIATSACGYRFAGTGGFPSGVNRIFINLYDNRTSETGIENIFTDELINEFTSRGNASALGLNAAAADAVLTGVIKKVRIYNISKASEMIATERRVIVTVDATLTAVDGRTLWRADGVQGTDTFKVDQNNKDATEVNKRAAIARAANELSEKLYNRLVEEF